MCFGEWQTLHFGSEENPIAAPEEDPDGDGQSNRAEFLGKTNPNEATSTFPDPRFSFLGGGSQIQIQFTQPANRAAQIQTSTDLSNWTLWDVPGNSPQYPSAGQMRTIMGEQDVGAGEANRYFRLQLSDL